MIVIKNSDLTNLVVSNLEALADHEMDIKTSFELAKIIREVKNLQTVLFTTRSKLEMKHIKKDKSGKPVFEDKKQARIALKDPVKYQEELEELLSFENKLKDYDKISLDKLGDDKIKPKILIGLEWLLDD